MKLARRCAFALFVIVAWGELIMMFTKYKTIGLMIYEEYGKSAIGYYYLIVAMIVCLLLYISSKLEYLVDDINKKLTDKN
ncbi:hypothetical protein [Myroides sp. LoEW2-1]|uniref:hypothetical protein n=1 Tax=Myroides sp. LoEW2-1 TaxID=2683192 RepID=UPI0013254931|nr:hypothetical protein [Myroides sp. LoEW2-1]MVX34838.1 hypothetical protein [Myroides sp. LoEW2-1]